MAAFVSRPLPLPPRSPALGPPPDSKSHDKCVNQRAGKYRLLAERAWEGNVTPAVTLEQKKQAVASPLSTPSVPSNKDVGENEQALGRAEGRFEPRPWRRNMAGTYSTASAGSLGSPSCLYIGRLYTFILMVLTYLTQISLVGRLLLQ